MFIEIFRLSSLNQFRELCVVTHQDRFVSALQIELKDHSSIAAIFFSMASRARNIRLLTVPTGHSMTSAISS